jgi:DNA replication protein
MAERPFQGFPDGRLEATIVPSLFFSELLGQIDDLAELRLLLFVFWRLGQKKGLARFLTRDELLADEVVRTALEPSAIEAALERLVHRRALIHREIVLRREPHQCYFLNTAGGRRAVRALEDGTLDIGQVVRPEPTSERAERPNIYRLYEENVGIVPPLLVDELAETERLYPGEWIEEAFREAIRYNRRNWRYIRRILERWAERGKVDAKGRRGDPNAYRPNTGGAGRRGKR